MCDYCEKDDDVNKQLRSTIYREEEKKKQTCTQNIFLETRIKMTQTNCFFYKNKILLTINKIKTITKAINKDVN